MAGSLIPRYNRGPLMSIREHLLALPFVATRRLSAREGFFTAGKMFALLSADTVLLRLPASTRAELALGDLATPLIGTPDPAGLTWVSMSLTETATDELLRLVVASHDVVRRVSRRLPRSRGRRRRVRTTA